MKPQTPTDPLGRQLEVYEESWKKDHEEVRGSLWTFEDSLAVGLALFKVVHDRYWTWRERIGSGTNPFRPEDEEACKSRFVWWLRPCQRVIQILETLEGEYGVVEGGREFRRYAREARQILETWTTPKTPAHEPAPVEEGMVPAHTDDALSLEQLGDALNRVSCPAVQQSVPLKHEPDYTQAF